jgi:predicted patatin/cPLA2 family phospholipase
VQSIHDEKGLDYIEHEDGTRGYMALAVSGGGAFGAFGAGFVNGWTDAGTRPVFKLVTGISAGPWWLLSRISEPNTTNSSKKHCCAAEPGQGQHPTGP